MAKSNKSAPVAIITLYGTHTVGAGWLARIRPDLGTAGTPNMLGTGEPKLGRSFTEAVWSACEAIRQGGVVAGTVQIAAPGGMRYAEVEIDGDVPIFGSMTWKPVTAVQELSAK